MRSEIPIAIASSQILLNKPHMHGELPNLYGSMMHLDPYIVEPAPVIEDPNALVNVDEVADLYAIWGDNPISKNNLTERFSEKTEFSNDFKNIAELEKEFYDVLETSEEERKEVRNYNPIFEFYEWNKNVKTPQEIKQFKEHALQQIKTGLFERNSATVSVVEYAVGKDGKIYNSLFPKEPFEVTLQRGVASRELNGSKDLAREKAELEGWKQACTTLMDPTTPLGTIAVVISPPSTIVGSIYKDNFIDMYKNVKDPKTEKISIVMTRFASGLTYKQNFEAVKKLSPQYFAEHFDESQIPNNSLLERTFLGNPIWINSALDTRDEYELMDQHFGIRKNAMKAEDATKVWERTYELAKHFLDTAICTKTLNPKLIAKLWNSLLVKNDLEVAAIKSDKKLLNNLSKIERQFANIQDEISWLSKQEVKNVDAACGLSAGFGKNAKDSVFKSTNPFDTLSNSVAQFGLDKDKYGGLEFDCPKCHNKNTRPYGKLLDKCKHCGSTEVACKNDKEEASVTKLQNEKKEEEKLKESSGRIFLFPRKEESKKKAA